MPRAGTGAPGRPARPPGTDESTTTAEPDGAPCGDPEARRLLLPYGLRRANEFEQHAFESHLLGCDACYQDLVALLRFASLLDEWTDAAEPAATTVTTALRRERRRRRVVLVVVAVLAGAAGYVLHAVT
jgi:hypothetical protein